MNECWTVPKLLQINARLLPGPWFQVSPCSQQLVHRLALVSPFPLPSYASKPRLINCSFMLSFQSLSHYCPCLYLYYRSTPAFWAFLLSVFASHPFIHSTRVSIQNHSPRAVTSVQNDSLAPNVKRIKRVKSQFSA